MAQVHVLQLGVEPEGRVHSPGVRCSQARLLLVQLIQYCALIGRKLHSDEIFATPALLCHKELEKRKNAPSRGFWVPRADSLWYKKRVFLCSLALSLPDVVVLQL